MSSALAWRRALMGAAFALATSCGAAAAQDSVAPMAPQITLAQALERAQAQSPRLTAAEAAVKAAEGRARQAGLGPNPDLRLGVENLGGSGPYRNYQAAETTLAIGQRIELGGKRRGRLDAAEAEVKVAQVQRTAAGADLARDVRVRFAEAAAAKARLALALENQTRAEDLARVAQTLVDAGRDPPLRALRARTALAEAGDQAQTARVQAASAARALATLWSDAGETPDPIGPWEPQITDRLGVLDPGETLSVALAEAELAAARAAIARERTAGAIDVTVEAGVRRFEDTGDGALIVGLSAPIPIRDRNQGAVAAARADAVAAEARRNQALAEAVREIRDAQAALRTAQARQATLETVSVPEAEEALKLARQGYEAGKFALIDVLDAQAALAGARTALIEARLARAQAAAALDRAGAR